MHGATGAQRSRAQLNIGLCLTMEGKIRQAVRAFKNVLTIDGAAPEDSAEAQRQLQICARDSRDGVITVPEPDLAAAYRGVRPESTSDEGGDTFFTHDALGGTLARDHQSRAMFFAGKHRRTYVAYLDHHFMARVTYYDHDTKSWAWRPDVVDQCQDSYCFKDGHNAPNIFVSRDGTIHLFYGSHGSVLKYARSVDPECIKQFQIGMRIGRRMTYPYLCQRNNGELLLFYRRSGPRGGYYHGHMALRRSSDNGTTWSDIDVLLRVEGGTKLCNNAVVYNAAQDRVHIMPTVKSTSGWNSYYLEYDPESCRLFSMDGADLGTSTTEDTLVQAGGKILGGQLENMCAHGRNIYMVGKDSDKRRFFGMWDGDRFLHHVLPEGALNGAQLSPSTLDGEVFRTYGLRGNPDGGGQGLAMWQSNDGGRTWDPGRLLVGPAHIGHAIQTINVVMNYAGDGPILVASEPTGPFPEGWIKTQETHYDNPGRRDRRLYAVEADGAILRRASPFKPK